MNNMNSELVKSPISNITNLSNRVNKLYIPKTKSLLPLFEVVSNSIHAIFEKREIKKDFKGKILINLMGNPIQEPKELFNN